MQWKVLQTKGEYEPWWFFKDWEKKIEKTYLFPTKQEALEKYREMATRLIQSFPEYQVKKTVLLAAWQQSEVEYCEDCGYYIQIFHGLIIMVDQEIYKPTAEEQKTIFNFENLS